MKGQISIVSGSFPTFVAGTSNPHTVNVRHVALLCSPSRQTAHSQHPVHSNRIPGIETPFNEFKRLSQRFSLLWLYARRRRMILRHKLNNPFAELSFHHVCVYWGGTYTRSVYYQHIYTRTSFSVHCFNVHTL